MVIRTAEEIGKQKLLLNNKTEKIQKKAENVRNICILAHVDHGKTTFADFLISANGIISKKMAGQMRYMDSTDYEQEKGITIKSSSISLSHKIEQEEYLIISSATRLTDGALVLIDVTEGVCIQTRSVLNQAFLENIEPVLVFNKMDRLITDLQMTSLDAYQHLSKILQEMNVVMSGLKASKIFKKEETNEDDSTKVIEQDDNDDYFSPQKGNVCFCSSIHGWAFKIEDFANIYHEKLGMKKKILMNTLWGEFYLNSKTKTIKSKSTKKDEKPMFVQFILDNIWNIYQSIIQNNKKKIDKIIQTLKLNSNFLSKEDSKFWLKSLMSQWLPLSNSILDVVCNKIPSPIVSQRNRILSLIPDLNKESKKNSQVKTFRKKLKKNLLQCDRNGEIFIFVSKMIEMDSIPEITTKLFERKKYVKGKVKEEMKQEEEEEEEKEEKLIEDVNKLSIEEDIILKDEEEIEEEKSKTAFVAFSRIFSGTIKVGDKVKILGARYNYNSPDQFINEVEIKKLFMLMGKSLLEVNSVSAGCIFGIGGVEDIIHKTATISTSIYSPIFTAMYMQAAPIVKFAIEPKSLMDNQKLVRGLQLLNQCDPSVEIYVQETGENVLLTAGEVHAERCIRDLNEKFCKIPIIVSPPIVSFRETVVNDIKNKIQIISVQTPNKKGTIKIKCTSLPFEIANFIDQNQDRFRNILTNNLNNFIDEFSSSFDVLDELKEKFKAAGEEWESEWKNLWSLGPKLTGPNILLNHIPNFNTSKSFESIFTKFKNVEDEEINKEEENVIEEKSELLKNLIKYSQAFISGFQLATQQGPLCHEPQMAVCYSIEEVEFSDDIEDSDLLGPFKGQIMSCVKEGCTEAFDQSSKRLIEAIYKCDIQANELYVGRVYPVLYKRRAKIHSEDYEPGTQIFTIYSSLPVAESFGFSNELRIKTSGGASASLLFDHWQILDIDPFFVPTTEDELEEFGDNIGDNLHNIARDYIDAVRKRKGLQVNEKLIESSDKQRNLSKNK